MYAQATPLSPQIFARTPCEVAHPTFKGRKKQWEEVPQHNYQHIHFGRILGEDHNGSPFCLGVLQADYKLVPGKECLELTMGTFVI
jgi:hypothetical protein